MPAVSKGDGMRGLAVFISDIRNCKFDLRPFWWLVSQREVGFRFEGVRGGFKGKTFFQECTVKKKPARLWDKADTKSVTFIKIVLSLKKEKDMCDFIDSGLVSSKTTYIDQSHLLKTIVVMILR